MALPKILDLNFKIDEKKLWKINLPIEENGNIFSKKKWIILDGVHRFTKAVLCGNKTIKVRKVSDEIAQKTKRKGKKWEKRLEENMG